MRIPFYVHAFPLTARRHTQFRHARNVIPSGESARGDCRRDVDAIDLSLFLTFPIMVLFATYFLTSLSRGALFGGSMNFYAVYAYDVDAATVGLMAAAVSAVGIPVTILAGHVMDRFGRKATVVPGFTLLGLSIALMAVITAMNLPFSYFVVALIGMGLTQALTGRLHADSRIRRGPSAMPEVISSGSGIRSANSALFMSPAIFGLLTEHAGSPIAFSFLAVCSLGGAAMVAFLIKETLHNHDTATHSA